jgi:hypothetical protein
MLGAFGFVGGKGMERFDSGRGVFGTAMAQERPLAWAGASIVVAMFVALALMAWGRVHAPDPRPLLLSHPAAAAPTAPPRALDGRSVATQFLQFEPNRGQAPKAVRYVSRGPGHSVEVFDDGLSLAAPGGAAAQLRFVGARSGGTFEAREPAPGHANYLVGAIASRWIGSVPRYRQLRYAGLYAGIDLVYYSRGGEMEFDLVVRPGADPSRIRLHVGGAVAPALAANGDLLLDGAQGALRLHRPVLYQNIDGQRRTLEARYVLRGERELGFELPAYDKRYPLVIDPVVKLLYSTYLGGVHDDQVGAMALDAQGNAYVVGNSGSEDWPVSANAYQSARKAIGRYVRNVVVTKFDASGTLVYSTFLGGTQNDYGSGIAVDAAGNAYLTGSTVSPDFPVTANALQPAFAGAQSAYLAVLSPDGAALRYASFYGGGGGSQGAGIALDATGTAVLAGRAGPGLPTTAGAYKPTLATGNAAFIAKFSTGAAPQLLAASYYGVDNPDANGTLQGVDALGLALDASGAPWITGQAFTTNLPVTAGAVQAPPAAMSAGCAAGPSPLNGFAFVAKLSADLGSLAYASYLSGQTEPAGGTSCSEFGRAITLDGAGNVYVTGGTPSATFPTTAGALQPTLPIGSAFASYSSFLTKLSPDGGSILWSTYFGGNVGSTFPGASLVYDAAGSAVWLSVLTGGGSNYPVSSDAYQAANAGGTSDAGVARFDAASGALQFSSYLGGNGADAGLAMAVGAGGNAFIAGTTTSTNLPVSASAFQPALTAGAYDGSDWFFSVLGTGTIGTVSPATAGNAGDTTLLVNATGIGAGAVATLESAGGTAIAARRTAEADQGGRWPFTFALAGAAAGSYDLVVRNPDGTELRKAAALVVTAGQGPKLSMAIVGRSAVRVGTAAKYELSVTNAGDSDAYYAVVRIALPAGVQTKFTFGASVPQFAGDTTDYNANPGTVVDNGTAYTLAYFPVIPAGRTASLGVELTAADASQIGLEAILLPSYLPSLDALQAAVAQRADRAYALAFGRQQPLLTSQQASKCASDVILLVAGGVAVAAGLSTGGAVAVSMAVLTGVVASSLVNGPQGQSLQGQGLEAAQNAVQSVLPNALQNLIGAVNVVNDCDPDGSLRDRLIHNITPRASIDPNDKSGPQGDGSPAHYVSSAAALPYQIAFENQASAGLPAAQVVVSDQLDAAKFDLSSVSLGDIAWGPYRVSVPSGLNSYATVYPIDATMSVRIQGSLDTTTGLLKWTFTTIDPVTKLPPSDPTLGFLPPDTDGLRGQGYVGFTVAPKAGAADGTAWQNSASIVFDANAAILTPTWTNTLDNTAPVSAIRSLTPVPGGASIDVAWSGTDAASGARSFTVFVSDNGGAFTPWKTAVADTAATYDGTLGHTYGFYVVATDGAGNVEAGKSAAEQSIVAGASAGDASGGGGGGGCTLGRGDGRDPTLPLLVLLAGAVLVCRRYRPSQAVAP